MGLILNGNKPNNVLYNGAGVSLYFNGSKIWPTVVPVLDEVTIGTQTWKNKNLAIDDGQGGIYTHTINYGQGDVIEYYYTWEAAVRVAASIQGWHLPSQSEWNTLTTTAGGTSNAGKKLKATYGWISYGRGTDDFGFTVLPAGYWYNDSGTEWKYGGGSEGTTFWTSNESSTTIAYVRYFITTASIYSDTGSKTRRAYSVRLIKDS